MNFSGTVLDSESYNYNQGNQRTAETNAAGDYRNYTYDNIGELKTANGKESGGTTNRLQEQLGYGYDAAGNLNQRTNNALVQNFGVNNLNELTAVTRNGTLTVAGTTTSPATNVTVNGSAANLYADTTFAKDGFSLADGTNTFTAIAKDSYGRVDTNSVTVNLPATNNFAYDLNGNLLSDGKRGFDYDDENELVRVTVTNQFKKEYVYDGLRRLRIRKEFGWTDSSWTQTNEIHYIWDGDVILQQRDANNLPKLTFTRGRDLSGSLQRAGGIGGLLAMTEGSGVSSYYHADGNGNVTCLISANQIPVAKAEYDPYGNFLSLSGSKVGVNSYWYSSKPIHWQSGKYDYLLRWYIPDLDRFASQDPIQEAGGINLYEFVANDPVQKVDYFGEDVVLGDAWSMAFYGLYGPWDADVTISDALIQQAKQRLTSLKSRLDGKLRSLLKCGQSGHQSIPVDETGFSFLEHHITDRINMGNWQVNVQANCAWSCEKPTPPDCCCSCKVICTLNANINKIWTFNPWGDYNPENIWFSPVYFQSVYSQWMLYGRLNPVGGYRISADFTDLYSTTLKPRCKN